MLRRMTVCAVVLLLLLSLPFAAFAHSGGTDGAGGHYNHSTGEYHYHHGKPAHDHPNGVCPYSSSGSTDYSSTRSDDDGISSVVVVLIIAAVIAVIILILRINRRR